MSIRIRTTLGKKLGLPGYSSKSDSLEIEAELAEQLLGQTQTLLKEIERLFELASQAVDAQLRGPGPGQTERNGEPSEFRPATPAQIHALARINQCAVKGVLFPVGANPTRRIISLQPVALGAVQGGNELD